MGGRLPFQFDEEPVGAAREFFNLDVHVTVLARDFGVDVSALLECVWVLGILFYQVDHCVCIFVFGRSRE